MTLLQTKPCPECRDSIVVDVTPEEYAKFCDGVHVQNAFPRLSNDDRERFISGYCPTCWDKLYESYADEDSDA